MEEAVGVVSTLALMAIQQVEGEEAMVHQEVQHLPPLVVPLQRVELVAQPMVPLLSRRSSWVPEVVLGVQMAASLALVGMVAVQLPFGHGH